MSGERVTTPLKAAGYTAPTGCSHLHGLAERLPNACFRWPMGGKRSAKPWSRPAGCCIRCAQTTDFHALRVVATSVRSSQHGLTERLRWARHIRNQTVNERHQVRAYWSGILAGTQGSAGERDAENFNNSSYLSNYCVVGTITAYWRRINLVFSPIHGGEPNPWSIRLPARLRDRGSSRRDERSHRAIPHLRADAPGTTVRRPVRRPRGLALSGS